jgi:hypothetical protein
MDTLTKRYRESELDAISCMHPIYKASIKISDNFGQTKWLAITDDELKLIKEVLTKGELIK